MYSTQVWEPAGEKKGEDEKGGRNIWQTDSCTSEQHYTICSSPVYTHYATPYAVAYITVDNHIRNAKLLSNTYVHTTYNGGKGKGLFPS